MDDDLPDGATLDPEDWEAFRAAGHRMLDDMVDFLRDVRDRPAWQKPSDEARALLATPAPSGPTPLADVYDDFRRAVLPFATGNVHPGFVGWVHGSGTPTGMLAELLAAGMNANLGGRDHGAILVERQVIAWCRELFGFPEGASGLLVTGTSMANLIAVIVARTARLGPGVRATGLRDAPRLTAYAARSAHGCVTKAMEMSGIGAASLRLVPTDASRRADVAAMARAIADDRRDGAVPLLVVGTAGTVDTGAIDDLPALAALAASEGLWFHVDGAFGALAMMSPELRPRLAGIERADSLAFDFHKWAHVPYDAGFVLVRSAADHRAAFANPADYLSREPRGLAAGETWPCDLGPDLSRGFRALKVWMTLQTVGTDALGEAMEGNCRAAQHLASRLEASDRFELAAPVGLCIVCFSVRGDTTGETNRALVMALHEAGLAAPSTTVRDGRVVVRAAIFNHRTTVADIDAFVAALNGTLDSLS